MSVRVGQFLVVYESVTMTPIDPESLSISKEDIEKYMEKHPMPEDPAYTKEDLIADITESNGFYSLPANTKQETRDYVAELLNELLLMEVEENAQ